jgi:AbiU2
VKESPRLPKLKVIVNHVVDSWGVVLSRQAYLHALDRHEGLHKAFEQTYAAHVHIALKDVLFLDLVREVGALVLDTDKNSASVARACAMLQDPNLLDELQREYLDTERPLPRSYNDDGLSPEERTAYWKRTMRGVYQKEFDKLHAKVTSIEANILKSEVYTLLKTARNKVIAHYDVVRDGADWKIWPVGDTGLTYGQVDEYVDACTVAVASLASFVTRTAMDYQGTRRVANGYVRDYIDALRIGLRTQHSERTARLENMKGGA